MEFIYNTSNDVNCNINVSTCEELVDLIVNEHSGVCTFNSCLGKWLCFDSNGCIYPCDRLCTEEFLLGNIVDMTSIDEAFENVNFFQLLKNSVERRKICMDQCDYYKNCYAGCNANFMLSSDNVSCYIQKGILKGVKEYILEPKTNYENMNHNYVRMLSKK